MNNMNCMFHKPHFKIRKYRLIEDKYTPGIAINDYRQGFF